MPSLTALDQLPAPSRNWAWTVFTPLPPVSVHGAVDANAMGAPNVVPSLEKRIPTTPVALSVAASESVTLVVLVVAAPALMTMLPAGGVVSGGGGGGGLPPPTAACMSAWISAAESARL